MAGSGAPKTGGREKGTPNKIGAEVRAMILAALDRAGGEDYLVQQAKANPAAFLTLIGKGLPTTLAGDPDNPVRAVARIEYVIVDPAKEPPSV